MCQRDRLANEFFILNAIVVITSIIVISSGAAISTNEYLVLAYGTNVPRMAKVVSFMGVVSLFSAVTGLYSAKSHNKFCLLVYLVAMCASTVLILGICAGLVTGIKPPFSETDLQTCTSVAESSNPKQAICNEIRNSDYYINLRLVWQTLHFHSVTSENPGNYLEILEAIQTDGQCCGFDQPLSCNFGPIVPSAQQNATEASLQIPGACGPARGWFQPSYYCELVIDQGPPEVIACPFYLPAGTCITIGYELGCALQLDNWLASETLPAVEAAQYATAFHIVGMVVGVFMFLKKKPDDILPTEYIAQHADEYAQKYALAS